MGNGLSGSPDKLADYYYKLSLSATKDRVFSNGDVAGKFYGFDFENNSSSADVFILIYDKALASVTVGSTVPDQTFRVPAGANFGKDAQDFGVRYFKNGMVVACSGDRAGSTSPASNATVHIWYRHQGI